MFRILFLLALLLSGSIHAQKISLVSDSWPPFTNYEDQVHYASDIVNEALKRSDYDIEIGIIDFGGVVSGIKNGDYDGSAALWKSAEREEFMIFSKPYLQNQLVLVGMKGKSVAYTSLADLRGQKLAIVESYDYGPDLLDLKTIRFVKAKSDQECLNMLLSGKADYILLDNLLAHHLEEYQEQEVNKFLAIGERALLIKSLHFALSKNVESAAEIVSKFDQAIIQMIKDGSYNELLDIDWILADIDGDGEEELVLGGDKAGVNPPDNIYQVIIGSESANANQSSGEYYIEGKIYDGWESIPDEYKLKPFNNSNNINILTIELNKK